MNTLYNVKNIKCPFSFSHFLRAKHFWRWYSIRRPYSIRTSLFGNCFYLDTAEVILGGHEGGRGRGDGNFEVGGRCCRVCVEGFSRLYKVITWLGKGIGLDEYCWGFRCCCCCCYKTCGEIVYFFVVVIVVVVEVTKALEVVKCCCCGLAPNIEGFLD